MIMMNMMINSFRNIFLVLFFISSYMIISGCNRDAAHDNADDMEMHDDHADHESTDMMMHDDHGGGANMQLTLNNGEKWNADVATNKNVSNLKTVMHGFDELNATLDSYHQLGNDLKSAADQLISDCRMKGPDHDALHVWLMPLLEDIKVLRNAPDKATAKQKYVELMNAVHQYEEFFE